MRNLTVQRVRDVLDYEAGSGVFRWKKQLAARGKVGTVAGNVADATGRRTIRIDGELYLEHRLVWLYVHGRWPVDQIDHVDGNAGNNRLNNLREATNQQNNFNKGLPKNNTSGIKGVSWDTARQKWTARIRIHGKVKCLGRYASKDAAAYAYRAVAERYHGEFARLGV
jgi:hypothetical protein